ncbi:glycosyltransferase family 39 protein [Rhodovastum atsumiense]|uniref:Glycosyltransferase RgtA/B/C/D-like domain-containing protein n=1 Tax=Rhodovastum atsumiense TaxID=504468 RepID=A0A5M6IU58_9PROT|nr:glycosyltransferase family 39 protein [Rhodovastum atsumiense]KAA5611469.1 hypothetical protein F1189_14145 [Rhodovastum atsumiense]
MIIALAVALRVIHLDRLSLWNDELFSRYYAELFGLGFLWGEGLRREPNPPLYYTLLHVWIGVFGDSATALRAPSVLAGCAALPIVHALGREFGDARRGLLGMLLFALSPMAIYFSQEARVYAFLLLPAGGVLLAIAHLLRDPRKHGWLWGYGLAALVGIYSHPTFPILLIACNLAVPALLLAGHGLSAGRGILLGWFGANSLVAVAGLPVALALAGGDAAGALDWVAPLRLRDIAVALSGLVSGVVTDPRFPGTPLAVALLLALAAGLWVDRPGRREFGVLVLIPALFLGLVIAASLARPILLPRVLCWLTIPLCVLLARGLLAATPVRPLLGGVTAVTFAVGLGWQLGFADDAKEPWRDVLGGLRTELGRADLVVLGPSMDPVILRYYAPGLRGVRIWDNGSPRTIENTLVAQRLGVAPIDGDALLRRIRDGKSVWLIANYVDQPSLPGLLAQARPRLRIDRGCGRYTCVTVLAW